MVVLTYICLVGMCIIILNQVFRFNQLIVKQGAGGEKVSILIDFIIRAFLDEHCVGDLHRRIQGGA